MIAVYSLRTAAVLCNRMAWTARHSGFVFLCQLCSSLFRPTMKRLLYNPMDHIFTVLPGVLRKRGLHEHAEGALMVLRAQRWIDIRLPHLQAVIRVQKFQENTLHIVCTHSIAIQECQGFIVDLQSYIRSEGLFQGTIQVRIARQ